MDLQNKAALIFVPDLAQVDLALSRTTALCIAAHQDDIEIMGFSPIADCYRVQDKWFTGVVVTDGAGSPRNGKYSNFTDDEMKAIRVSEQNNAATVGEYSAQLQLGYPSSKIKASDNKLVIKDLANIISSCKPDILYTHNLADKHDTHVAVALRVIEAVRSLPPEKKPKKMYSLEVWRGLDWLNDEQKLCLDCSKHPNLAAALLGVFDSQIAGGKRYDSAAIGRRLANATFFQSHSTDDINSLSYGLDITELMYNTENPLTFINRHIQSFMDEVSARIASLE